MATIQDVFSHIYTTEAHLGDVPVKNGQIILCTDSEQLYIDHGTTRVSTSDVIQVENQEALPLAPLDKLYITKDTGDIFFYINGAWEKINQSDISVGAGLSGNGSSSSPLQLDIKNYSSTDNINLTSSNQVNITGTNSISLLSNDNQSSIEISATGIVLNSYVGVTINSQGNALSFATGTNSSGERDIYLDNHSMNTAGGFAVVDLTTGKLPIGIIPDVTGDINIDNYTSNSTIRLTSTAGAVNLISNTGEVGLYSGNTAHIKANVDTVDLKGTTLAFNGNATNTANGLVVLGADGKIPTSLYDATIDLSDYQTNGPIKLTTTSNAGDGSGDITITTSENIILKGGDYDKIEIGNATMHITSEAAVLINGQAGFVFQSNGTDVISESSGHLTLADGDINISGTLHYNGASVNAANGLVQLDDNGKILASQLPEMTQSWTKVTINQSSFATSDDTYGGSYYELDGICSVEVYDADGYKVEFDVKCDFTNSKTRIYIPSGLTADTISNWTLLYLAKTIA